MEYKIECVRGKSKKLIIENAENKMNEMARDGWKVTTMTEFMAVEFGYSILIAFEK